MSAKHRRKIPFVVLFCALGAAGGGILGCHSSAASSKLADPPAGEVWLSNEEIKEGHFGFAKIEEREIEDHLDLPAKISFDDAQVEHVYSPVSGRIRELKAQLGAHVKKGDILAFLESPEVGLASADVSKARADLSAAEHNFKRQKELAAAHAVSERDVEQAEDDFKKAKAELDRSREKQTLFGRGADGVTQSFAVRAGIEGEVVARFGSPGMEVQGQYAGGTSQELFTVGRLDHVWVLGDVHEQDLGGVVVGSKATVSLVAFPGRMFEGSVDWVSRVLDPATRTARVRISLANADSALRPEMYATVRIRSMLPKALAIPRTALVRLGTQVFAFVRRGVTPDGRARFERIPVHVDDGRGDEFIAVPDGLKAGDEVVTEGAVLLLGKG